MIAKCRRSVQLQMHLQPAGLHYWLVADACAIRAACSTCKQLSIPNRGKTWYTWFPSSVLCTRSPSTPCPFHCSETPNLAA